MIGLPKLTDKNRLFGSYFLFYLFFLFLYRVLFLFVYRERIEDAGPFLILQAFAVGFRFDFSVIAAILTPFYLLSQLNFLNRFRIYRHFWTFTPLILSLWCIMHLIADIVYFNNANKHIGYEGFVFLGKDLAVLFESFLKERTFTFLLAVFVLTSYLVLGFIFINRKFDLNYKEIKLKKLIPETLIVLMISVILLRGGLQKSFLRPSNSIVSENAFINSIGLNAIFTTFYDLQTKSIPANKKIPLAESTAVIRDEINYRGAEFLNTPYPLLRKTTGDKQGKAPNVVIVLLESWSAKFIKPISPDGKVDGKEVTPYFNKLLKEGVFFTKFFATGGRTTNGLLAALNGIPDRPGTSSLHSQSSGANQGNLALVLKQLDYQSLFMTGSDLGFENLEPHIKKWGFDAVIDKKVIDKLGKFKQGIWGYDDNDGLFLFNETVKKFDSSKPFLAVYLTISTHYPYKAPDPKFEVFSSSVPDYDYLNVYHYADWSLGNFMEQAKKEEYFKDTIFIFLSDHTHHRYLNYYEDRNIPLLIYAPGRLSPSLSNKIGSQLDLIPTVLGLIGKPVTFFSMGKDMFDRSSRDSAYFAYGSGYGWIDSDNIYFFAVDIKDKVFSFNLKEPFLENDICKKNPVHCALIEKKATSFLNSSVELPEKNLVFPIPKLP